MSDVVVIRQPVTNVEVVESDLTQAIGDARYAALAHHTRHEAGGADGMAIDAAAATGSLRTLGTGAAQAAAGTHAHSGTYLGLVAAPGGVDDTAVLQAAINAANAANGGTLQLSVGTYVCTTLTMYGGVHLAGAGIGGDVFSDTDVLLPFRGTCIKLKAATNADLIQTTGFTGLDTGVTTPTAYNTPHRFGLRDLVLDGNKAANSSGRCLAIYGYAYTIERVTAQNGATGGIYTNSAAGGYEMEAFWSNFRITDCGGTGLDFQGPHDSLFVNGAVARNASQIGINVGPLVGAAMFTNVHSWGSQTYGWVIAGANSSYVNCQSDGCPVNLLASGVEWIGGFIYGANTSTGGEQGLVLGDNTVRTIQNCRVVTRMFFLKRGSAAIRIRGNTTHSLNQFDIIGSLNAPNRYVLGEGHSTLSGSHVFPTTPVTVADASSFPASGSAYIGDGTNQTVVTYTGVSGNTLTGVTGGSGTFATGAHVWSTGAIGNNAISIYDDGSGATGQFQTAPLSGSTFTELRNAQFSSVDVRPNSSATAFRLIRNDTARTDLTWDNSGSTGVFTVGDGANFAVGTTTGTKLGTATSQKIGLWNATPVVQPVSGDALRTALQNVGILPSGGANLLNVVDADVNAAAAIAESKLALASDAAVGTASRRTLGTGSTQAAAGDHLHTNTYVPSSSSDLTMPRSYMASPVAVATTVANRGEWVRCTGSGTITKLGLHISVSSGNICAAVYANTGTGRSAKPGTRKSTSGSVACPGTGYQEITISSVAVVPGDWFYIGADNAVVQYQVCIPSLTSAALDGFAFWAAAAFPAPDPAPALTSGASRAPFMVGT